MKKSFDKNNMKGVYRFKVKKSRGDGNIAFPKSHVNEEENDINLMMIFGMDREASRKNPEKYNKLKSHANSSAKKKEFTDCSQIDDINNLYASRCRSVRLKMLFAFLIFVTSAVFEYLMWDTYLMYKLCELEFPMLIYLAPLQLVVFIMAIGYRQLFAGLGFAKSKTPASTVFSCISIALFIYYTLISVLIYLGKFDVMESHFGFYLCPCALCLVLAIYEELSHVKREWTSFTLLTEKNGNKFVLEQNKKGSGKRFASKEGKMALSVKKAAFVTSFMERSRESIKKKGAFNLLVLISFAVSLGLAVYKYVISSDIGNAFSVFVMTLVFTLPFSGFVSYSVGYKRAVDISYNNDSTIIGLSAFEDYQAVSSVYFDDLAVFPPSGTKLKGFKSYGGSRIDISLAIVRQIYKTLDSPPAKMFAAVDNGVEAIDVDIIEVTSSGVHAAAMGKAVYLGDAKYMTELGLILPEGEENVAPNICPTYLAVSGTIVLKMYIEYTMNEKMLGRIEALKKYGIYMGICTSDPNINDRMMNRRLPVSRYPVGILKPVDAKIEDKILDTCSSGIVSNKGTGGLLSTLLMCINMSGRVRLDMIVKYFALAAGVIISALVTLFGIEGHIDSWFLMLYQLFWLVPSMLIAMTVRKK